MKKFTLPCKFCLALAGFLLITGLGFAQSDSSLIKRVPIDSTRQNMNMDAVYNRPFLLMNKLPVAIGGYAEANTFYAVTDGVSEGFSFRMQRMTLFVSSTVAKKIKFLSEIEFEDGTKEISLEYAALDLEFHPSFNFRGGILLNPIGSFNQNHDGPRWDFIDRPLSSTTLLPATLSSVGMGFNGKYFTHGWIFGYEAYLTNGFDNSIIDNEQNRTSLPEAKENPNRFEESSNGVPMFTGKIAIRSRKLGELGISFMNNVYNKFRSDGLTIDSKRNLNVFVLDFNTSFLKNRLTLNTEVANIWIQIPENYSPAYGNRQAGFYADVVYTFYQKPILGWEKAKLNFGIRTEYVDYNIGAFTETNQEKGDDVWALVPALAFRPVGTTVLRLNYRYEWRKDLFGNPPSRTGAIEFGFSAYF